MTPEKRIELREKPYLRNDLRVKGWRVKRDTTGKKIGERLTERGNEWMKEGTSEWMKEGTSE